jgi:hypothetical protein
MFLDPLMVYLNTGLKPWSFCEEHDVLERDERNAVAPNTKVHPLIHRRALPAGEGRPARLDRRVLAYRNPARRAVFRLLGSYFTETEAREILRCIHDYKWIEAEKAGFDIWCINSCEPLKHAAQSWARHHLSATITAVAA